MKPSLIRRMAASRARSKRRASYAATREIAQVNRARALVLANKLFSQMMACPQMAPADGQGRQPDCKKAKTPCP